MQKNGSSLKRNYFYNMLYRIVTLATPLITSPYISRVLGADGIGQYSYTYAVSHYFFIFAVLGVSDYGNREIAKVRDNPEERSRVFIEIFALQLFLGILLSCLYFLYTALFAESRKLAFIQGMNVLTALFDVTWFLFGMELFLVTTVRNVTVKIGSVILILLLVKKPSDVWIYAIIMAGSTLLGNISVLPLLRKHIKIRKVNGKSIFKHLKPNLILFLPVIANNLLGYFDKIMIGKMSIDAELGCYDNAEKLLSIPNSLITALGTVMLPRISNSVAKGDTKDIKKLTEKSMLFVLFSTIALSFGISAVAKEFVPFFFGKGFDLVIPLIYTLAPYIIFVSWANVLKTQVLLPNGKDKTFVICLISGAVTNVILNYFLIPRLGAVGAAIATTFSEGLIAVTETIALRGKIETKKYIIQGIPFAVFGVVMILAIWNIQLRSYVLTIGVKIIVGAVIYLLLSLAYIYKFHKDVFVSIIPKKKVVK